MELEYLAPLAYIIHTPTPPKLKHEIDNILRFVN